MTDANNGGSAFPVSNDANVNGTMGMTLRDYFAAQVSPQILASLEGASSPEQAMIMVADMSYKLADAMLDARKNNP